LFRKPFLSYQYQRPYIRFFSVFESLAKLRNYLHF